VIAVALGRHVSTSRAAASPLCIELGARRHFGHIIRSFVPF